MEMERCPTREWVFEGDRDLAELDGIICGVSRGPADGAVEVCLDGKYPFEEGGCRNVVPDIKGCALNSTYSVSVRSPDFRRVANDSLTLRST